MTMAATDNFQAAGKFDWLAPAANALQIDLDVSNSIVVGTRKLSLDLDGPIITMEPDIRHGWINPISQHLILILKLKGRVYALFTYDGITKIMGFHLIDRTKFKSSNITEVVPRYTSLRTTLQTLAPGIFATFKKRADEANWKPNDLPEF